MSDVHGIPDASMIMPDAPDGVSAVDGPISDGNDIDTVPADVVHDAGTSATVSGSVEGAVTAAFERLTNLQAATFTAGSTMGDLLPLPEAPDKDSTLLGYVAPDNIGGTGTGYNPAATS